MANESVYGDGLTEARAQLRCAADLIRQAREELGGSYDAELSDALEQVRRVAAGIVPVPSLQPFDGWYQSYRVTYAPRSRLRRLWDWLRRRTPTVAYAGSPAPDDP